MSPSTISFLFCELFVALSVHVSAAQGDCSLHSNDDRIFVCGSEPSSCHRLTFYDEEYAVALTSREIENFRGKYYDVHAYRLCGDKVAGDVTLADAIQYGEECQSKTLSQRFRALSFTGCSSYFEMGSNSGLTIYAYNNASGCNGELLYRFLVINGTRESPYTTNMLQCLVLCLV